MIRWKAGARSSLKTIGTILLGPMIRCSMTPGSADTGTGVVDRDRRSVKDGHAARRAVRLEKRKEVSLARFLWFLSFLEEVEDGVLCDFHVSTHIPGGPRGRMMPGSW